MTVTQHLRTYARTGSLAARKPCPRARPRWAALVLALVACGGESTPRGSTTTAQAAATSVACGAEARQVVERLGAAMRRVSLLAPDSIVHRELADAYGALVTPRLLDAWAAAPRTAPGREVSSPWPARVEIRSAEAEGDACRVAGDEVYVTSADTTAAVERRPVTARVVDQGGWRVDAWSMAPAGAPAAPAEPRGDTSSGRPGGDGRDAASGGSAEGWQGAADVVRRYYAAIDAGDYAAAYALWGDGGRASGKSRTGFAAGFASTASVRVTIGDSSRVGAAAGSRYATVPVTVDAVQRDGSKQRFAGSYTLRRSVVDGATAAQRRWHIYTAELKPVAR